MVTGRGNDTTALFIGRSLEVSTHMDAFAPLTGHKVVIIPLTVDPGTGASRCRAVQYCHGYQRRQAVD